MLGCGRTKAGSGHSAGRTLAGRTESALRGMPGGERASTVSRARLQAGGLSAEGWCLHAVRSCAFPRCAQPRAASPYHFLPCPQHRGYLCAHTESGNSRTVVPRGFGGWGEGCPEQRAWLVQATCCLKHGHSRTARSRRPVTPRGRSQCHPQSSDEETKAQRSCCSAKVRKLTG